MAIRIKKTHKFIAIVFLIIYFLYLVVSNMPARYVAALVQSAAPGVYLNSVYGTVWRGVSRKAQVNIQRKPVSLGTVKWKVKLMSLLTLKGCVDVEATEINQVFSGVICRSITGSITLDNFDFDFPVEVVDGLFGVPSKGQLSGKVISMNVTFSNNQPRFTDTSVKASWNSARIYVDNIWYNLGTHAADISHGEGGALQAKIFDIKGPYGLDAQIQWLAGGAISLNGTILPKSGADQQVVNTLDAVFEQTENGAYKVQWPL